MERTYNGATVDIEDHVAIVTFSRPPLNYFDIGLINGLADALEAIDREPELRATVLQSEGDVFCAGALFSGNEGSGDADLSDPGDIYRQAVRIFRVKKPIVAAIQGPAIGGGLGLSLIADFRVAAPEARFAANFVKIGIHPGFGLTHTLPRVVGQQAAALLLYTGRRIKGEEAHRIGLADIVAPRSGLYEAALELATEIAGNSPLGLEATRATMRRGLAETVAAHVELECAEQIALFASEDFKEGVRAVSERRPGRWVRA